MRTRNARSNKYKKNKRHITKVAVPIDMPVTKAKGKQKQKIKQRLTIVQIDTKPKYIKPNKHIIKAKWARPSITVPIEICGRYVEYSSDYYDRNKKCTVEENA